MFNCPHCRLNGYCINIVTELVTDDELDNPEYLRDVRALAHEFFGKDAAGCLDHFDALYRDYRGWICHEGTEIFLDMEEFDRNCIDDWFERFCCTRCPPDVTPRLQERSRERVRIVATILKAHYPVRASLWGVRPANDNAAPSSR